MRICLCFNVLLLRFYRENWRGGGGGGVVDLVYGSSSSFNMDWGEFRMLLLPIHLYRVRLTQCSCVDASSLDLVIYGCTLYGSSSCRMSTRRLPVILFVSRFECTLYPVVYCLVCLWWPRRFIVNLCPTTCQYFTTFSKSFTYYPPPAASIGYPTTLPLAIMLGLLC